MINGARSERQLSNGSGPSHARYMEHVVTLLRRLRTEPHDDDIDRQLPPEAYIGNGSSTEFWELIGFRIWGHPYLLLAAARFARHEGAMVEYGRESLPFYLTYLDVGDAAGRRGPLEVIFPKPDEPVPDFLEALRAGEDRAVVRVDPSRVQFAFDFRTVNPSSLSKIRPEHTHPRTTAFRTTDGHILIGTTKNLPDKLRSSTNFLVLLDPVQRTTHTTHVLPTLVLHRSFIAAAAESPEPDDDRSFERLLPFSSGTAATRPLLLF